MRQLCEPKEIGADGAWATISWSIAGLIGSPGGFWPCQPCCPFIEPGLYWGVSNVMIPLLSALATSMPPIHRAVAAANAITRFKFHYPLQQQQRRTVSQARCSRAEAHVRGQRQPVGGGR